jgi:hypothetical protein
VELYLPNLNGLSGRVGGLEKRVEFNQPASEHSS